MEQSESPRKRLQIGSRCFEELAATELPYVYELTIKCGQPIEGNDVLAVLKDVSNKIRANMVAAAPRVLG